MPETCSSNVTSNNNGNHVAEKMKHLNGVKSADEVSSFLNSIFSMCLEEGYLNQVNEKCSVVDFKTPEELQKIFQLKIDDSSVCHEKLLSICKDVFAYSVKTGHPHFFNQLYAGIDPYGFAASVITDVLNTSIYTYEVTPVFVMMENFFIAQMREIIGYENGDGTFSPGGSYSNMLGMNLARFRKFPSVKEVGMRRLPRMVAFCSDQCHYSNKKNASLLGIGTDDLLKVDTDKYGRMDVGHLQQLVDDVVREGAVPFCVIATSGTTVLGAYDPLAEISQVCSKHDIWLHVDAAWGGSALFSGKHKHLLNGIEKSDSVAWNLHKLAMAPLQSCLFITKHSETLSGAHSLEVPYLFQTDKTLYDPVLDIGKKVVQCGRKVDVFKCWFMLKALGMEGMEKRINKSFENSRYLAELVENREGFHLLQAPECTNVCFWFVPAKMRKLKFDLNDENFCRQLSKVAPKIKEKMTLDGSMLVGFQPLKKLPNFFRMVVINDRVGKDDMEKVVEIIERLGNDL